MTHNVKMEQHLSIFGKVNFASPRKGADRIVLTNLNLN